jgi:cytochrome c
MRKISTTLAIAALTLALGACGSPPEDKADTAAAPAADTAAPAADTATPAATAAAVGGKPAVFAQCATCHAVEPGKNGVGPSLAGVFGKKAGGVAGFAYTDANKNSGLTWDEATLDTYLTNPMKMVPGTKMTFAGLPDAAKRKEVIEYLKTLK